MLPTDHVHRFTGFYHQMRIVMYRPSPQVPKPSPQAANICFESAAYVLKQSQKQIEGGNVSITWLFLLTLNAALNAILWSTSYLEVRRQHPKEEVEAVVNMSLMSLDKCVERWPDTAYTSELYGIISKACLQSYDLRDADAQQPMFSFASPPSVADQRASPEGYAKSANAAFPDAPQFSLVFDSPPESMNTYTFDPNFPPHPTFRSNSIFRNPASDSNGRRFSYFPPDSTPSGDAGLDGMSASSINPGHGVPSDQASSQLPTPPESVPAGTVSSTTPSATLSSPGMAHAAQSGVPDVGGDPGVMSMQTNMSPPPKYMAQQHQPMSTFGAPRAHHQPQVAPQQKPLPTNASPADWFSPPAPFISPYNFGPMSGGFFNDAMPNNFAESAGTGLGLQGMGVGFDTMSPFSYVPPGRQGSLTQSQQMELMNTLETEGMGDIDAFLSPSANMADTRWY